MYVLDDDGIKGECVVTDEGEGVQLVDMVYLRRKLTILN